MRDEGHSAASVFCAASRVFSSRPSRGANAVFESGEGPTAVIVFTKMVSPRIRCRGSVCDGVSLAFSTTSSRPLTGSGVSGRVSTFSATVSAFTRFAAVSVSFPSTKVFAISSTVRTIICRSASPFVTTTASGPVSGAVSASVSPTGRVSRTSGKGLCETTAKGN